MCNFAFFLKFVIPAAWKIEIKLLWENISTKSKMMISNFFGSNPVFPLGKSPARDHNGVNVDVGV